MVFLVWIILQALILLLVVLPGIILINLILDILETRKSKWIGVKLTLALMALLAVIAVINWLGLKLLTII